MTLTTLRDVRKLIEHHLPMEIRKKDTWQYVAKLLSEAARGADTTDVAVTLQIVLSMEGVRCRPK